MSTGSSRCSRWIGKLAQHLWCSLIPTSHHLQVQRSVKSYLGMVKRFPGHTGHTGDSRRLYVCWILAVQRRKSAGAVPGNLKTVWLLLRAAAFFVSHRLKSPFGSASESALAHEGRPPIPRQDPKRGWPQVGRDFFETPPKKGVAAPQLLQSGKPGG